MTQSIRQEWFQGTEHVSVSLFLKGCSAETVQVVFTAHAVDCQLQGQPLHIDLYQSGIVPAESTYIIRPTKVELRMKKRMTGLQWPSLGPSEEAAVSGAQVVIDSQLPNAAEKPPSYPSSSKHKKDWSQVERAVEEDKPEGEQALNALFQQIFKDGSDEVRKAMMKSYVESGGTCLSTNWDEVKNDKVPVRPPEGMEAKQW